jgi:hypothetical protein
MYQTLIAKIKTTLQNTTGVASFGNVPGEEITKYPHVFFKPAGFINQFETNEENYITYNFLMVVMVTTEGVGGSNAKAFDEVLPSVIDNIIQRFNADWDQGTIDGHRVTTLIDSADAWELSEEEKGMVAYAPLSVQIKLLTSN